MKNSNLKWGIIFIAAAFLLIMSRLNLLGGINAFEILLSVVFGYYIIKSLLKKSYSSIFFPIAFILIIYDKELGITVLTPWTVLIAALFLTIGFSFLFSKKQTYVNFNNDYSDAYGSDSESTLTGSHVYSNVRLSSNTKYVDTPDFTSANLCCSLGESKVFFDKAVLNSNGANINVSVSLGTMSIYIPSNWNTVLDISCSLGDIKQHGRSTNHDGPKVVINGLVRLGDCNIYYV